MRGLFIIVCGMLVTVSVATAQKPSMLLGIGGAYYPGMWQNASANIPFYPGSEDCGVFGSGTSSTIHLGAEFALPSLIDNGLGLSCGLGWERTNLDFTAQPYDTVWTYDNSANGVVPIETEQRLALNIQRVVLKPLLRIDWDDRLSIEAGLTLGIALSSDIVQQEVRLGDSRFIDGSDTRTVSDGTPLTNSTFTVGGMLGLSWRALKVSRSNWVTLGLSGRLDPAPVSEFTTPVLSVGAGASLLLDLTPHPDSTSPPPPVRLAADTARTVPADSAMSPSAPVASDRNDTLPPLDVAIDIYSIGDNGEKLSTATVRVYEVVHREMDAGVRTIYFSQKTAQLPGSATNEMLDSLAVAMQANPAARAILVGSRSQDEAAALARERAREVRDYLVARGIAQSRIEIAGTVSGPRTLERTGDDLSDSRYVAIESDIYRGDERALSERVEREYEPPSLKLEPRINASAGVRKWTIQLLHNGRQIARYSSDPGDTLASRRIDWRIDAEGGTERRSLLIAALTVEDSAGRTTTSRSQIPLFIERNVRIVERTQAGIDGREHITWSLLSFTGNGMVPGERNQEVLSGIADVIRNGAQITVIGYGEEAGMPRRRADAVAALLRDMVHDSGRRNVRITADVRSPSDATSNTSSVDVLVDQPSGE